MASSADNSSASVQQQYRQLQQELQRLSIKISELEQDRNEHILVETTLAPLDGKRTAYRLVGEVLVQRTVEEIRPSVASHREQVCGLLTELVVSSGTRNSVPAQFF
jgi:prefoldin subunit 2